MMIDHVVKRSEWHPSEKNERLTKVTTARRISGEARFITDDGDVIGCVIALTGAHGSSVAQLGRLLHNSNPPWQENGTTNPSTTSRLSSIRYPHMTFGATAPQPLRRRYGCRNARLNTLRPDLVGLLADIFAGAWPLFEMYSPEAAALTMKTAAAAVHDDWRFCDTPWTSGIINHTAALPYHRDSGNLLGTWSAMVMCKRGCEGGELHLPEYNILLDVPDKSLCIFDGQAVWHGVAPFTLRNSQSYRYSAVMYAKTACRACGPAHDEAARAAREATSHDITRSTVLGGE